MPAIEIKNSAIHGRSIYAAKDFEPGELICEWSIECELTKDELPTVAPEELPYLSEDGRGGYVILGEPDRFMNHSCDPNTKVVGRSNVAVRKILAGEELTTDYDKEGAQFWFECSCGAATCRGAVGKRGQ